MTLRVFIESPTPTRTWPAVTFQTSTTRTNSAWGKQVEKLGNPIAIFENPALDFPEETR